MKNLLLAVAFLISTLVFVGSADAQDNRQNRNDRNRQERYDRNRQERFDRFRDRREFRVVNEYRNVQIGRRIYRETYRTTYRGRRVVSRVLINRYLVRNYDRKRSGFRFNIYLPF